MRIVSAGADPRGGRRVTCAVKITTTPFLPKWRGLLLAGAGLVLATFTSATLRATERWETLQAIHWVENPTDTERPGRYGELGAYQFRETTWRMHTTAACARATDRRASDEVAIRHYEWLKRELVRNGVEVTPYNMALAWNGGLRAAVHGPAAASTRDYAERENNLAQQLKLARVATSP